MLANATCPAVPINLIPILTSSLQAMRRANGHGLRWSGVGFVFHFGRGVNCGVNFLSNLIFSAQSLFVSFRKSKLWKWLDERRDVLIWSSFYCVRFRGNPKHISKFLLSKTNILARILLQQSGRVVQKIADLIYSSWKAAYHNFLHLANPSSIWSANKHTHSHWNKFDFRYHDVERIKLACWLRKWFWKFVELEKLMMIYNFSTCTKCGNLRIMMVGVSVFLNTKISTLKSR